MSVCWSVYLSVYYLVLFLSPYYCINSLLPFNSFLHELEDTSTSISSSFIQAARELPNCLYILEKINPAYSPAFSSLTSQRIDSREMGDMKWKTRKSSTASVSTLLDRVLSSHTLDLNLHQAWRLAPFRNRKFKIRVVRGGGKDLLDNISVLWRSASSRVWSGWRQSVICFVNRLCDKTTSRY